MAKSVKPAQKGCKSKSLKQRPAARPAHSSKAGLTAEKDSGRSSAVHEAGLTADPPSRLDDDAPRIRCRNAFQLFYANALKESTHTNSTAASAEWKKMTDEQKKPWVEGALQENTSSFLQGEFGIHKALFRSGLLKNLLAEPCRCQHLRQHSRRNLIQTRLQSMQEVGS